LLVTDNFPYFVDYIELGKVTLRITRPYSITTNPHKFHTIKIMPIRASNNLSTVRAYYRIHLYSLIKTIKDYLRLSLTKRVRRVEKGRYGNGGTSKL